MKKALMRVISLASLVSLTAVSMGAVIGHPSATAQEVEGCFMVDSSGRRVSLGSLCGEEQPSGANKRVFIAKIKRRDSGTPVIDVTFNGSKTFEMIVDTGASGTLITRPMAAALRVVPVGKVTASIADGSQVQFLTGDVRSISVDGAVVNNVRVAIADKADIGLLGHDFFDSFDVKIKRDVVEFHRR